MKIVAISAGLSAPSSTRLLADQLAEAAVRELDLAGERVELEVIELRPLAHALADNLTTGFPSGDLAEAIDTVAGADALIAVTPVFTASYSGLFKTFFDVLDKDLLAGVPVQIAATAGTARHSLVLDHAVRPLFAYLRAVVLPTGVFAASEDFGSTAGGELAQRVARAGKELADHLLGTTRRSAPRDEFADPVPFDELLRGA
ncbi:FMN reductase [Nocardioides alcanivorans]|uniref:FMN reductase n=1 Tax=Nocardioides alcanivorans TaxID=2897352 RepID=UPI001F2763B3|nr:FMN reductase [Nocardioides alcanivorans]